MLLSDVIDCIIDEKEVRPSADTLECWYTAAVRDYEKFLGRPARIEDLNRSSLNKWIDARIVAGDHSPYTIKTRRGAVIAIWNGAVELDLITDGPKKIRRPRLLPMNPTAWEHAEVQELLNTALHRWPKKYLPNVDLPRGLYFASAIAAGYDTALRLGDLLSLERDWIRVDTSGFGNITIVQSKTGRLVGCKLQPTTMQLIDELMRHNPSRRLIWPAWARREAFYQQFRKLVKLSGIRTGTFRYLRRSSTTHVEIANPGKGQDHAAHADAMVTRRHYLDAHQLQSQAVCPPALQVAASGG